MNGQDLKNRATQIRDEKKVGANTAERIGGLMHDMLNYSIDNRRALNGDKDMVDGNSYPYLAVYIETSDDWSELNKQISDINSVATTKYNGNIRYYLSGVRVDIQNRTLNYANKYTSQVAVGPLQVIGGKLAQATTADKTFRRIYNGSWSPWEEVAATGKTGSATGAEVFNSYSGDAANIATGIYSHAEGFKTKAQGISSHAEGDSNTAFGAMSHAEGVGNFVSSRGGHVEGGDNRINSADGATGRDSGHAHAEGYHNEIGPYAPQAHVEGSTNFAGSRNAHVEGYNNRLENGSRNAHIEGENNMTQPDAHVSHTEGGDNRNNGAAYAHIEGKSNVANTGSTGGHVEGLNNTINNEAEHASGHWNLSTPGKTHFSVGIGSSNDRKNAYEIDKQGNIYMLGVNGYDGKGPEQAKSVQALLNSSEDTNKNYSIQITNLSTSHKDGYEGPDQADIFTVRLNKPLAEGYYIGLFRKSRIHYGGKRSARPRRKGTRWCLQAPGQEVGFMGAEGYRGRSKFLKSLTWEPVGNPARCDYQMYAEGGYQPVFNLALKYTNSNGDSYLYVSSSNQRYVGIYTTPETAGYREIESATVYFAVAVIRFMGKDKRGGYIVCSNMARFDCKFFNYSSGDYLDLNQDKEVYRGFSVIAR